MAYQNPMEQKKPAATTPWSNVQPIKPQPIKPPTMSTGTPATMQPKTTSPTPQIAPPTPAAQQPTAQPFSGIQPLSAGNLPGYNPTGFQNLRTQTIGAPRMGGNVGAPSLGGNVSAPKAAPRVAAQDPSQTLQALQQALQGSQSPMADQLRQMGMTSLQGLSSAPNRASLAAEAFRLQNEASAPAFAQDIRKVGQAAAAFGRTGSGMTTNELTDLALTRGRDQDRTMAMLANDAAGLEMSDRLGIFDRTAGYGSQIGNQDLDRAGFGQSIANNQFDIGSIVRDQNVGERDFAANEGWRRTGLAQDQQSRNDQNAWRGTDLALNQQGRNDTNAWRGVDLSMQQQGRQDQQGQQAIENARMQELLQEQLLEGQYGRDYRTAELAGREGYGGAPWNMQMDGAGMQQNNASNQAASLAAQQQYEAMQRALASYGQGGAPAVAPPVPGRTYDYRNPNAVPGR